MGRGVGVGVSGGAGSAVGGGVSVGSSKVAEGETGGGAFVRVSLGVGAGDRVGVVDAEESNGADVGKLGDL